MYSQATANTRVVGLEIGYLVNWLITEYGVDPANVHLMGHSLGAHASGYAGEQIQGGNWSSRIWIIAMLWFQAQDTGLMI